MQTPSSANAEVAARRRERLPPRQYDIGFPSLALAVLGRIFIFKSCSPRLVAPLR